MNRNQAETIAIAALGHIAADADAIAAFLAANGADASDLRRRAQDGDFLGFVLDFILGDDRLAGEFCHSQRLSAEKLHHARAALPGGQTPDWT